MLKRHTPYLRTIRTSIVFVRPLLDQIIRSLGLDTVQHPHDRERLMPAMGGTTPSRSRRNLEARAVRHPSEPSEIPSTPGTHNEQI
jgi:hypothetical protein